MRLTKMAVGSAKSGFELTSNSEANAERPKEDDDPMRWTAVEKPEPFLLQLPDDVLQGIFSYLPVTLYGTKLAYISRDPHWQRNTGSQAVMKHLCERVYLQQSKKKQLRVSRFGHSYRFMLYQRPRVQAGGGVYVLRCGRLRPVQRDLWTADAILETVYYRYLYFKEDGRCLYALSANPPQDMLQQFHQVLLRSSMPVHPVKTKPPHKSRSKAKERNAKVSTLQTQVAWGTYTVQKDLLTVSARQSWQTVQFGLRIVHSKPNKEAGETSEEDRFVNGSALAMTSVHGRFGVLQLETHRSSKVGDFERMRGVVHYNVEKDQVFRFLPDPRF